MTALRRGHPEKVIDQRTMAERQAADAVAAVLEALRHDRQPVAVAARLDQARAAVRLLDRVAPLTAALGGLLDAIERCHTAGRSDSPDLQLALFDALVTLYRAELARR